MGDVHSLRCLKSLGGESKTKNERAQVRGEKGRVPVDLNLLPKLLYPSQVPLHYKESVYASQPP